MITLEHAETFERCMTVGGVAVFPSDTVYGLACDVGDRRAVENLYGLKGRRPDKPSAVMFFSLELALGALGDQDPYTLAALKGLLPGAITVLLNNHDGRYPLACGPAPDTIGLRVPALGPETEALRNVSWPILQSSANLSGAPDACSVGEIAPQIVDGCDLVLDAGTLPGTPSTVLDLRGYEADGNWKILREGSVPRDFIASILEP
ncbi:MAG TPA: L-threonylcarbamoyladenylate synthase [Baekduia sp.]|nr:L-threonylcarbamoyladenylate synthase [Baekduia sp.]